MSTGLFANRTPHNQNVRFNRTVLRKRAHRKAHAAIEAKGRCSLDQFTERLAEHGNVALAAKEIGKSDSYGRVLLQRAIRELGWQAR